MGLIISVINTIISVLIFAIFIYVLLSFFLSPFHPVRRFIGSVVEPMLIPIRKLVPPIGGFDFSPLILIILLQIIGALIGTIINSFR